MKYLNLQDHYLFYENKLKNYLYFPTEYISLCRKKNIYLFRFKILLMKVFKYKLEQRSGLKILKSYMYSIITFKELQQNNFYYAYKPRQKFGYWNKKFILLVFTTFRTFSIKHKIKRVLLSHAQNIGNICIGNNIHQQKK